MKRESAHNLTRAEKERYARHLTLPEVGVHGQSTLKASSVLVVGAGGLGNPAMLYLAAAGVGRLGLVDFDRIEESNLQRQVLYRTEEVGRPKASVAGERVRQLNPNVTVDVIERRVTSDDALDLIRRYDVVVDGCDNLPTRYALNDACVEAGRPYVYGSVYRFEGQVSVFHPPDGPCYRCPFPIPPEPGEAPGCAEGGVLGVLPGLVGTIQATEALKLLIGCGSDLRGRLLLVDALDMAFREIRLRRDPSCPTCGTTTGASAATRTPPPGSCLSHEESVPLEISPEDVARKLRDENGPLLLDVRTEMERQICRLEGSVHIAMDEIPARSGELDPEREIVVYCHHGPRSAAVVRYLRDLGFHRVLNLTGGIDAWARSVDASIPRY